MKVCVFCFTEFEDGQIGEETTCPACKSLTAFKPELETKLFKAQYRYEHPATKTEKEKALGEMFEILRLYAWGKLCNKKRHIPMLADEIDDYAHDAASKFIEHYLKDENFHIDQSFGGYLGFKIWDVLHNKKKRKFEEQNILTNEAEVLGKTAFNSKVRIDTGASAVRGISKLLKAECAGLRKHYGQAGAFHLLVSFSLLTRSVSQYQHYVKNLPGDLSRDVDEICFGKIRDELMRNAE